MRIIVAAMVFAAALGAAVSFQAQADGTEGDTAPARTGAERCAPYAALAAHIITRGGRLVWAGITQSGEAAIEIWQSGSGSWLEIGRLPSGLACVMDGGEGGRLVPQDTPS
jgi:hypothetical protein